VYTRVQEPAWSVSCHKAGANALLSKDATLAELSAGMREALEMGCFTDPRFLSAAALP
jgi:DNA-binding NarL/FixJ family response regulator